jgi:hypothetical protein
MMDSMAGAVSTLARRKSCAVAAALLYGFVLLAAGFAHHDFECHRKSPTHCTSCVFSQGSAGVATALPAPLVPAPRPVTIALAPQPKTRSALLFFGTDSSPPFGSTL